MSIAGGHPHVSGRSCRQRRRQRWTYWAVTEEPGHRATKQLMASAGDEIIDDKRTLIQDRHGRPRWACWRGSEGQPDAGQTAYRSSAAGLDYRATQPTLRR